jgi:hypothetical protein
MNESYNSRIFSKLQEEYASAKEIYNSAFDAKILIEELYELINESERNGVDVFETKRLLYVAEVIYGRGDYVEAYKKLKEAKLTYALETKGEFNLYYTVKNNPLQSLGVFVAIFVVSLSSSLIVRRKLYQRKLRMLLEEEKLLLELMKVIQRETFEKNHMSMEEYGAAMSQYEFKLGKTVEEKISIETKLSHMLKVRGKEKALIEEKKRLIKLIRIFKMIILTREKLRLEFMIIWLEVILLVWLK